MEVAHLDQLLDVVGDVRAEVVAAGAQLARRQLLVADVVEEQRLDAVDVVAAAALELVLDDVEQAAMEPLHEVQGLQIMRLHRRSLSGRDLWTGRSSHAVFMDRLAVFCNGRLVRLRL